MPTVRKLEAFGDLVIDPSEVRCLRVNARGEYEILLDDGDLLTIPRSDAQQLARRLKTPSASVATLEESQAAGLTPDEVALVRGFLDGGVLVEAKIVESASGGVQLATRYATVRECIAEAMKEKERASTAEKLKSRVAVASEILALVDCRSDWPPAMVEAIGALRLAISGINEHGELS